MRDVLPLSWGSYQPIRCHHISMFLFFFFFCSYCLSTKGVDLEDMVWSAGCGKKIKTCTRINVENGPNGSIDYLDVNMT